MDPTFVADTAELICRWGAAVLHIPEQPEEFWAEIHAGFIEEGEMLLNASAVMADWNQPVGAEV